MKATAGGMKDWTTHISSCSATRCTAKAPRRTQRTTWEKQYEAAPENIKAFKKATNDFKAPDC